MKTVTEAIRERLDGLDMQAALLDARREGLAEALQLAEAVVSGNAVDEVPPPRAKALRMKTPKSLPPAKPKAKKPTRADVAKAEKDASYWKAKYQAAAARAVERQADCEAKRPTDAQPTDEASASLPEQLAQAKARIAELEQENAVLRRRVRKLQVLLHEAPAVV